MSTQASWRYWPALDGVRALAVASVMVFHAAPNLLPGGFIGADAFFVLSGFLITGPLLAEAQQSGTIRLRAFWTRRIRRLLPALLLLLVAVVVGARLLGPAQWLPGLRGDTLAALVSVSNWWALHQKSTYFAHLWSLGIEGQFYLFWPILMLVALKRRRSRGALLALCGTGAVASALLCAVLYHGPADATRVYNGTDTRVGALLLGGAVAVLLHGRLPRGRLVRPTRWHTVAAGCAGVLLGAALTLLHADAPWLFRGGLIVVALAVAVVIAHLVTSPGSYPTLLLSLPPVVWVGRISYGLYLWHLPVYLVLSQARMGLSGIALFGLRVTATFLVATASFYLVELPIRRGLSRWPVPVASYGMAAAVATAAATALTVLPATAPPPVLVTAQGGSTAPARRPPIARAGRSPGPPRVTVFGDSVAWSLGEYLPPEPGGNLTVSNRGMPECGIARLPEVRYQDAAHTIDPDCEHWDEQWRSGVATDDPDVVVILLDRWELMDSTINGRDLHVGDPEFDAHVTGELKRAISIASANGARVVLLTAPYTQTGERPDGSRYAEDSPERVDAWNQLLAREATTNPARPAVLDLNRVVCPDGSFTDSVGSVQVRSDGLTFTVEGVQQVIAPWLLPRLRRLATR